MFFEPEAVRRARARKRNRENELFFRDEDSDDEDWRLRRTVTHQRQEIFALLDQYDKGLLTIVAMGPIALYGCFKFLSARKIFLK